MDFFFKSRFFCLAENNFFFSNNKTTRERGFPSKEFLYTMKQTQVVNFLNRNNEVWSFFLGLFRTLNRNLYKREELIKQARWYMRKIIEKMLRGSHLSSDSFSTFDNANLWHVAKIFQKFKYKEVSVDYSKKSLLLYVSLSIFIFVFKLQFL